jgi:hypothetical protein
MSQEHEGELLFEEGRKFKALYMADYLVRKTKVGVLQAAAAWARDECDRHLRLIREGKVHDRRFAEGVASGYGWASDELSRRAKEIESAPVGIEGLTDDNQPQYPLLPDREKPQTEEVK